MTSRDIRESERKRGKERERERDGQHARPGRSSSEQVVQGRARHVHHYADKNAPPSSKATQPPLPHRFNSSFCYHALRHACGIVIIGETHKKRLAHLCFTYSRSSSHSSDKRESGVPK